MGSGQERQNILSKTDNWNISELFLLISIKEEVITTGGKGDLSMQWEKFKISEVM